MGRNNFIIWKAKETLRIVIDVLQLAFPGKSDMCIHRICFGRDGLFELGGTQGHFSQMSESLTQLQVI
jgi:hypothetical protein